MWYSVVNARSMEEIFNRIEDDAFGETINDMAKYEELFEKVEKDDNELSYMLPQYTIKAYAEKDAPTDAFLRNGYGYEYIVFAAENHYGWRAIKGLMDTVYGGDGVKMLEDAEKRGIRWRRDVVMPYMATIKG